MEKILRFAPSPTGYLHFGNIRMAFFNYLLSKKSANSKFILRIDDTDLGRSKEEYELDIYNCLKWLGLNYDETFKQSSNFNSYNEATRKLIEAGRLYPCYETKEELEFKKKLQLAKGKPPIYDRSMLNLTEEAKEKFEKEGRKPHYRFKVDHEVITWNDLVKGQVTFNGNNISDPVLIKEDGNYLYTLCSVIDDINSKITHIVRGEDHLTNTAVHVQLFKFFGASLPEFAHVPLVSLTGGIELSKRNNALSIKSLREGGYHHLAILNCLLKLGQTEDNKLYFNLEDMIKDFDLNNYSKHEVKFDTNKLDNTNVEILQKLDFNDIKSDLTFLKLDYISEEFWNFAKFNIKTLTDVKELYDIIYGEINPVKIDKDFIKIMLDNLPSEMTLESYSQWINKIKEFWPLKGRDLFLSLRNALTAVEHGPELKNICVLMGVEKIKERLNRGLGINHD